MKQTDEQKQIEKTLFPVALKRTPELVLIPLTAILLAFSFALFFMVRRLWGGLFFGFSGLAIMAAFIYLHAYRLSTERRMDDIFTHNGAAVTNIAAMLNIPCVLFDHEGRIFWSNESFKVLFSGVDITRLIPGFNPAAAPAAQHFEYAGRNYQLMNMPVAREGKSARELVFQYWMDRTEALHYSRLYEERMPTVGLIYVDNYDDLSTDKQFRHNTVITEVEHMVNAFVSSIGGVYRRCDNARFFTVFEASHIAELERQRFTLLDNVRSINTGTGQSVTLSIAIGTAERVELADESARQAMEMALGRGGDQAVVKRGTGYAFYGGRHQIATTKQSRVKTRLFAKALRQLMENSTDVFIVGHKHPDMDCLGSALGLMRCAITVGCHVYFVLDHKNSMIENALSVMSRNPLYASSVKTPEQAMQMIKPSSVLITVDTQRESSMLAPELLKVASKKVVIDHHRRAIDSISNATLSYLESSASSICEIVAEVIQYFDENIRPSSFECESMLAGITIDTKRFTVNTGARTFEAASFLKKYAPDVSAINQLYQDDMASYTARATVIERAEVQDDGIAISACPSGVENPALLAAQAADTLVDIRGIQAAFVLAQTENEIVISGRSRGSINVQLILEAMGGGGHMSAAGAQLSGITMEDAVKTLKKSIADYYKEGKME